VKTVAVVGSSNTDMVIRLERIPKPGETLLGGEFSTFAGGKGANQAVAAKRAGCNLFFLARLGSDSLGDAVFANMKREGIDQSGLIRDSKNPSGVALITVSKSGQNSIAVAAGANMALSVKDVKKFTNKITEASVLLLQLETPLNTVVEAAKIASKAGSKVILNPAPAQKLPSSIFKYIDFLTPNEHEAELISGVKIKTV
jgi:ribokinase